MLKDIRGGKLHDRRPIGFDRNEHSRFGVYGRRRIQHFGNILNLLKSLSLSREPWPDYGQQGWDSDDEEIQSPPTTHFVATIDDLTNMLDFDSEDIDGMDADAGDDQEPTPIGH